MKHLILAAVILAAMASQASAYSGLSWGFNVSVGNPAPPPPSRVYVREYYPPPPPPRVYAREYYIPPPPPAYACEPRHWRNKHWRHPPHPRYHRGW